MDNALQLSGEVQSHGLVFASCVVDAGIAFGLLRLLASRRGEERIVGLPALLIMLLLLGVMFLLKLAILAGFGLNVFGAMRLAYFDLAIVTPLVAGVWLLVDRRARRHANGVRLSGLMRVLGVAMVIVAPLAVMYMTFIETRRLVFEQHTVSIPSDHAGLEPFHVGVLADIQTDHVGGFEREAIDSLMAQKPDLILIPGDLFQGWPRQFESQLPAMRELLGRLHAPGGVFFVLGNCEDLTRAKLILDGLPIRILLNEIAETTIRGRRIAIGGVELDCLSAAARTTVQTLETRPDQSEIRILMSHRPDAMLAMRPDSRIDLLVAGHTHGGQVVIPGFGPPITLTNVPRRIAAGGLHEENGCRVYVSRGLGHERGQAPRMRLFCPPEITLLTLEAAR